MTPEQIASLAQLCHEVNRAYCASIGDFSQKPWREAAEWQRQSAIKGVEWRLANLDAPSSAQHDAWLAEKKANGWTYGPVKDEAKKEHPCMVEHSALPKEQQAKDAIFMAIVLTVRGLRENP